MSGDVLGPEWHISQDGLKILSEIVGEGQSTNKQKLTKTALDVDLKNLGRPFLANEISKGKTSKVVLQIQKVRNISAPKANEGSQAAPRMLKITLTDGESYAQAIELAPINAISRDKTPPGTKVVIDSAKIVGGYLLLSPENCTVLGGQVPHMVEKWLLAKSVQQSHNRKASNDGAPLWVPFGSKIIEDNQDGAFKSLGRSENKDPTNENSEFDQQRKEAIAEASSGAMKKTFGGRAKQNVQPSASNQNRNNFQDRGKKFGKGGQRSAGDYDYEDSDRPRKPAEKVSLFDFLSDKLPITETKPQETVPYRKPSYNNQNSSSRPTYQKDNSGFKYEKHQPTPSQASKGYSKGKVDEQKSDAKSVTATKSYRHDTQTSNNHYQQQKSEVSAIAIESYGTDTQKKGQTTNNYHQQTKYPNKNNESYNQHNKTSNTYSDRGSYNKNNSVSQNYNKYNSNAQNSQSTLAKNDINKTDNSQLSSSKNGASKNCDTQNSQLSSSKHEVSKSYNTQSNTPKSYDGRTASITSNYVNHPRNNDARNTSNVSNARYGQSQQGYGQNKYPNENFNNARHPTPNHPPSNANMNQVTQDISKMSLNSEFAKRSLRNHLNISSAPSGGHQQPAQQRVVPPPPGSPAITNSGQAVPAVPVNNFVANNLPADLQVGHECMAKYWEDKRFYNAIITGVTDKTYVVKFRDYGNIEEVFKSDCFSAASFQGNPQFMGNQNPYVQSQPFNNGYIGRMEFKRRPNYNNN